MPEDPYVASPGFKSPKPKAEERQRELLRQVIEVLDRAMSEGKSHE